MSFDQSKRALTAALKANLDSALGALERADDAALQALAREEAQLMDSLRVIWDEESEE